MNIRKLLESHKEIDDRINLGLEEIAQLRALAERVTQRFTFLGSTGSGNSDRVGNYAVKIADLELRIDREIDGLVELRERIMNVVSALGDSTERLILERRYIMHEGAEEIGEKLGYSSRHVTRILRKAITKLEALYPDKEDIA